MVDTTKTDTYFVNKCSAFIQQLTSRMRQVTVCGNRGFTLVELIVVTAVLGVLAAMAMPAYKSYVESAKSVSCASDIRTIEKAITAYLLENNVTVPAATLAAMGIVSKSDPWNRPYEYHLLSEGGYDPREDIAGVVLNTDYDLYSLGENGASLGPNGNDAENKDDIVRSNDGGFVGARR
ncbi:MAG: prepilin-type N-terminal cleavage/methylation domain-containing protein [Deltaproteobacteria bacterium]